jgi:hypothetical protein
MKRHPIEWEKIFTIYSSDRKLLSKMYKELKILSTKKTRNLKNGQIRPLIPATWELEQENQGFAVSPGKVSQTLSQKIYIYRYIDMYINIDIKQEIPEISNSLALSAHHSG